MLEQRSARRMAPAGVAEWAAPSRRRGPRWKPIIGALVCVAALALLVVWGLRGATVYSLTVSELKARGPSLVGQGARVTGLLASGSVSWDAQAAVLRFVLRDPSESLSVIYRGARPDGMSGDAEVIAEGKLLADGAFEARALLFKCPSRYEAGTSARGTPAEYAR